MCVVRGGVFSCRARSRPNQTNVSTPGAICTLITHRTTIIGDPRPKNVIFLMPHRPIDWCQYGNIAPRHVRGRFSEPGLPGAAGPGKAQGEVMECMQAQRAPWAVLVGPWTMHFSGTACQFHSIMTLRTGGCFHVGPDPGRTKAEPMWVGGGRMYPNYP